MTARTFRTSEPGPSGVQALPLIPFEGPPRLGPQRCESCRLRPFEVIDSRFGQPAFGICYECFDGVSA
jgi:hypothetical protein